MNTKSRTASTAHTPGPWSFKSGVFNSDDDTGCGSIVTDEAGPWYIAKVESLPRDVANARLIAAAPDMLAALNEIDALWSSDPLQFSDEMHCGSPVGQAWAKVRHAIAKATGGTVTSGETAKDESVS